MDAKRRKRTKFIALGAFGAIAASLVAYERISDDGRCVDRRTQIIVDDDYCDSGRSGYHSYVYGSRGTKGSKAVGGSYTRGGFGGFISHVGG